MLRSTGSRQAAGAAAGDGTPSRWQELLKRFAGFYGQESTAIRHSHALFNSCYDHATQPAFREHLRLDNDFFHKHALINLHVWMVHNRLRTAPNGKLLQEQMFDRFWENTTERIRELGVPELTVNKHLRETQTFSFGAATVYDYGLAEGTEELAGSLYRNVFCNNQDIPELLVIETATYVQKQVKHLQNHSDDDVVKGDLSWMPALGCDGKVPDINQSDKWREAEDEQGRKYLYNVETRETKWAEA